MKNHRNQRGFAFLLGPACAAVLLDNGSGVTVEKEDAVKRVGVRGPLRKLYFSASDTASTEVELRVESIKRDCCICVDRAAFIKNVPSACAKPALVHICQERIVFDFVAKFNGVVLRFRIQDSRLNLMNRI